MNINNFWASPDKDQYYFIAEIGNNHNGSISLAKKLIDAAVDAGAHCVKFQMRDMNSLYRKRHKKAAEDLGVEYVKDLLDKYNLTFDEHFELNQYAKDREIDYLCTPWDLTSVDILEQFEVPAYKIASADFTNIFLVQKVLETGKPTILSTGMCSEADIDEVLKRFENKKPQIGLLHCNSTYPAPFGDINLRYLNSLINRGMKVGYSGHERGTAVSLAAYTLGARIIERHLTFDRSMEGPDHAASLEPSDLRQLISGLEQLKLSLGSSAPRRLSQGELINRENLAKSLVAKQDLSLGEIISIEKVAVQSPGRGLSPLKIDELLGKPAVRNVTAGEFFEDVDVGKEILRLQNSYSLPFDWGIPVRYHDFVEFSQLIAPNSWEFHLSYSDLNVDLSVLDIRDPNAELIIHAPELFMDSHLLDLTTDDIQYRQLSIDGMKKVIEQTKKLRPNFRETGPVKIVTNVGGFSMDGWLDQTECDLRLEILDDTLKVLECEDVEIIPQTMAPFPWHFGGQRYQNLFLDADSIVQWCSRRQKRICFDTSHSKLFCNFKDQDFYSFTEKVLPFAAHVHLGDASGNNGEGLQLGYGDINFARLFSIFKKLKFNQTLLPEIWQGHKNAGAGLAEALSKIEELHNEKI